MAALSRAEILREKNTTDVNSITSLSLTHKSLSNVECLSEFKNLERLDLTFNNLSSLQGLEGCVNLKWLNVQQNQLVSLKGIESLPNLNVLNAAKNKLRTMEGVKNIVRLNALILNDNEITSISGLDRLTALNTLVLSRNPISKMGNSLDKLRLIKKVSMSNCQLEAIDPSIKACTELQELRLAHNDIKTLPAELAYNKRLHILDVGNNMISRWSDLEVLSSLNYLKNLNLLGNPIAEKAKLLKKIKKLVPRLQVFNSKRLDKWNLVEENQKGGHIVAGVGDGLDLPKKMTDHGEIDTDSDKHVPQIELMKNQEYEKGRDLQENANNTRILMSGKKTKGDVQSNYVAIERKYHPEVERDHKKKQKSQERAVSQDFEVELDGEKGLNKSKKKEKRIDKALPAQEVHETKTDKNTKRKAEKSGLDAIDDKEVSFAELLTYETSGKFKSDDGKRSKSNTVGNMDSFTPMVTYPSKSKKAKNQGAGASVFEVLAPPLEIGLGGPSAWDIND